MATVPSNYRPLPGSERQAAPGARRTGRADSAETVRVLIRVRCPPDVPPPPDHDHWERTRPGHRTFLSRQELGAKYAAAPADLAQVAEFARTKGLSVLQVHAARRTVAVSGTTQQLQDAFAVDLGQYETHDEVYRGREGPVYVPEDVFHLVEGVFGLDNRRMAYRSGSRGISGSGGPTGAALTPIDVANLYNFPPIPASASMADQTIGVLEYGGGYVVDATGQPTDINSFITALNATYNPPLTLSPINVIPVPVAGGSNTIAGSASNVSNADAEVALDIDTTGSVANGASIAVYFFPNSQLGWLEVLLTAIFPDPPQPAPSVLSISWFNVEDSWPVSTLQAFSGTFQQAAEAGITVLCASGDQGSMGGGTDGAAHVDYPYCDPWVTACGGTQISNITWINSTTASAFTENSWNEGLNSDSTNVAITGGGISTALDSTTGKLVFPKPSWQQGFPVPPSINDNKTLGRGIPDIGGYANGYNISLYGSPAGSWWGTSETAPLYAGLIARINATLGFNVGYLNPTLYSLASSPDLFRDIHDGASDAFTFQVPGVTPPQYLTSPSYTSGTVWNALTGLGVLDGTKLLEALAGGAISPSFYFSISQNNFGSDEVGENLSWPGSFSLILDGVAPAQVTQDPAFSGPFYSIPGLTIAPSKTPTWPAVELGGSDNALQRITYSYDITFTSASLASFPAVGSTSTLSLTASIQTSVAGFVEPTTNTQFELLGGADPYFLNVSQQYQNPPWLSQDLRVFTIIPGLDPSPVLGSGAYPTFQTTTVRNTYELDPAITYVKNLITYLNDNYSDPSADADPFTTLLPLTGGLTGDTSVFPYTADPVNPSLGPYMNYNFAVARVRLKGGVGATASNVSVFFRLFLTVSNDTDYQPSTTYATGPQGDVAITPTVADESDPATIPFFATGNYEGSVIESDYVSNGVNNQSLTILGEDGVWAYFGCYLNVYDTSNTIGGQPVLKLLTGTHHCLVAQISFAGTPITVGMSTGNSPQLAQRNLQISKSDNPGPPSSHRVPQTFDTRPSASFDLNEGNLLNWPDEIMIDWGNVPEDSRASIYWPQVSAPDIIALASQLYPTHELTAPDANTLSVACRGQTYIPIPTSTSTQNFAGLLTVDLPQTVVTGQEFTTTVRRLTTKLAAAVTQPPPPPSPVPQILAAEEGYRPTPINNWRYVAGSFAVTIPVSTPADILPSELDTLAIFKWRLSLTPLSNRWYPVLQRYISYVEARVTGLGGNPILVQPAPYGAPPGGIILHPKHRGHTGKIEGLVYDRFGDFDGFLLSTEDGHERRFRSRKAKIEELVRFAWKDQIVITVLGEKHDSTKPVEIILRRWP